MKTVFFRLFYGLNRGCWWHHPRNDDDKSLYHQCMHGINQKNLVVWPLIGQHGSLCLSSIYEHRLSTPENFDVREHGIVNEDNRAGSKYGHFKRDHNHGNGCLSTF